MAMLLKIIILKSTAMPFRWHECKYMCFYCNDHFIESSKLKEHIVTHPDVDIQEIMLRTVYKPQRIKLDISQNWCTECSAEFDCFNDYIEHLFYCQNKEFDPEVVSRFEVFKLADDDLKCLECGVNFLHFGPLLNHTHQCHVNAEKNFRFLCEICGQGFCNKGGVVTHIRQSHFVQKCLYCPETFQTRYAVDKHISLEHKIERLQCPLCPDILPNRYQKKRHLAFKHDVKSVQLVCYICNKVFTRNNKLMMHIRRVHLKEKNVPCEYCGVLFFDTNELKKHRVTHSSERSFQCGLCQKIFRRKKGLLMHLTHTHGSEVSE